MMTNPITLEDFSNGNCPKDDFECDRTVIEEEVNDGERSCIIMKKPFCCIPDLGVKAAYGAFSYWNEETKTWEGDFSLTLLYDMETDDPQNYIYWEQGGIEVTLWNWLNVTEKLNEKGIKDGSDLAKLPVFIS